MVKEVKQMKKLRKIFYLLLVVAMLFNNYAPIVVLAYELNNPSPYQKISMDSSAPSKGNIEIETHLVLPLRNSDKTNIVFKIYDESGTYSDEINLNDVGVGYYRETLQLKDQEIDAVATRRNKDGNLLEGVNTKENIVYLSINLYSLNKGKYKIELSGKHFVTYSAEVTLDDFSQRLTITNENGLFTIGDITGDLAVNDEDVTQMLSSIETNNLEDDLNLDGVVDLADLNYITAAMTSSKAELKVENTSAIISSNAVSFEVPEGTLQEGSNLSDIFTGSNTVTLSPVNEGDISATNPINLSIDLSGEDNREKIAMSEVHLNTGTNAISDMVVIFETESGQITKTIKDGRLEDASSDYDTSNIHLFTDEVEDGTIVIKLGNEVAVKKVTIKITKTSTGRLADIAKVEFLNNVKVKTEEPKDFYVPRNVRVDDSVSEKLTISFDNVPNVTGYEIKVIGPNIKSGTTFQTTYNTFTVEDLKNYAEYRILVQAVYQEWRSGWSEEIVASPKATSLPPSPDMVTATATFAGIDLSWNDMEDTRTYNLYYREVGASTWEEIRNIEEHHYSLRGLLPSCEYEAYLTGNNDLGEGAKSQTVRATTKEDGAAIVPKYKIINDLEPNQNITSHISKVMYTIGSMNSDNEFAMVDANFQTYWEFPSWHFASHYYSFGYPITVLDKSYKMDEFVITVPDSYPYSYKSGTYNPNSSDKNDTLVHYWNNEENMTADNRKTVQGVLTAKTDEKGRKYYVLKLDDPIEANAIQIGLTVASNGPLSQVSEIKFYEYDSLVDDTNNLFTDDLHIELRKGVTDAQIAALRERANTQDHGEYSPYRSTVLANLDYAEKILHDEKIDDIITLNPNISNYNNSHLKFAMTISDYQPLGIVARPGDKLTIYVGSTGNVNAEVVYTQYYAEANAWSKTYSQKLQKGENIIDIDQIGSAEAERGGSVYIRYTSSPDQNNLIKIRVSGGTKIPMLDLSLLNTMEEKKAAIKTYIETLDEYTLALPDIYAEEGKIFSKTESVRGATEIVTKYGLFSVSSTAVKDALDSKGTTTDEKVDVLYESAEAFDEMMEMFYRQKGLSTGAADPKDEMPKARINIRYMRMFYGAFMYAGGYHIGIEYGSIPGLVQGTRQSESSTGYFGWGISHEIGHQINQSSTAYAEVTNNVYALLAETSNDRDLSRLEKSNIYEKIYDKVTSHTLGRDQNVFTQLGMYWQLHLAYDDSNTFADTNSIYARINHISRTYNNTKGYNSDELLILFASMASSKDLTSFFESWGLPASDKVKEEIASLNLTKEERPIYYLNDLARRIRLASSGTMPSDTSVIASITSADSQNKRVTISLGVTTDSSNILGYEIIRNGEVIGFVDGTKTSFTDNLGAENNRAYVYKVVAYDYLLNKTEAKELEEVKISHDGSIIKSAFTIESNFKEKDEIIDYENAEMDYRALHVNRLIDGDSSSYFNGTEKITTVAYNGDKISPSTTSGTPYVIISLNGKLSVSGIKYKAALDGGKLMDGTISKYKVYVSSDKQTWTEVKSGTFDLTKDNNYTNTVYFMKEQTTSKNQLWTYHDVSYIKIEAVSNTSISGSEIDIIAPPGDNVDISHTSNGLPEIGVLEESYCYLTDGCEQKDENGNTIGLIEAESVIIKGTYRGNPSFNIVTISDANDELNVYDGYQIIFAELNEDRSVYEVAEGTWIYVMTREEYEKMLSTTASIRANLYRVNDANTLDEQRLTSTSKKVTGLKSYEELSKIRLEDTAKKD